MWRRSQVVLLVWAEGVVDVSLQVDGQVRDPEQRPGHVNQPVDQPAVALRTQEDDTGNIKDRILH